MVSRYSYRRHHTAITINLHSDGRAPPHGRTDLTCENARSGMRLDEFPGNKFSYKKFLEN